MVSIRPARQADCAAVADIYRHYVEHTVATFDYEAPDREAWEAKLAAITSARRPFLVAADAAGSVLGFAYLGSFRDKRAYAWTAEDTIYLDPDAGGRGIGSALLGALLEAADPDNVRQVIAVIAAAGGEASIALHTKHGFTEVGRTPAVGYKFDQWIDCVYLQRPLR
ncbi:GNAT family N-acetyltransferase [Gordonia sp. SID5947]|uniref:GNAT family N-acetyltransferase n=1 Tax=Gordonia sp. SID5947 TaxID=2690315 RepID=UPI001368CCE8|nr:GNAT family N-acetyltransferase [Gordonia sp. SID5947]MYR06369.1 GNAT family N-acetyltransferase [Gordonia sp. SID5947]